MDGYILAGMSTIPTDAVNIIGLEAKSLMELINGIDPHIPDEDMVEVLIGSFRAWGAIEAQLLFPTLEGALEGSEELTSAARDRLDALYTLEDTIHLDEGAEGPFTELARRYIDGVKYYLIADVQDIAPLAAQLPPHLSLELADRMAAMKAEQG